MPVQIESTTDSKEQVIAAIGGASTKEEAVETKPESAAEASGETATETPTADETVEASGTSEEVETEGDETETEETGKPAKELTNYQKRINKLTKRAGEKEREAEYWRQEALKNQRPAEQTPPAQTAAKVDTTGRPKPSDFETHDAFVEALTDWKVEQKDQAREIKTKDQALRVEQQKIVDAFQVKVKDFATKHDDFKDLVESVDDIPMPITVQTLLLGSEHGPEVMYELAKNRDEYKRLCDMPAIAAAKEFGKIEARLAKNDPPTTTKLETKTTKAPKPIAPVGTKGSGVAKSIYDPDISQREFERLRREQESKRVRY